VRAVNGALLRASVARTTVEESRQALSKLDWAILAKAFRGELVPQDPSDEPVDTMLARVRTGAPAESPRQRLRHAKAAE